MQQRTYTGASALHVFLLESRLQWLDQANRNTTSKKPCMYHTKYARTLWCCTLATRCKAYVILATS
jgi:hypothetical protein